MIQYMMSISGKASELVKKKLKYVFKDLENLRKEYGSEEGKGEEGDEFMENLIDEQAARLKNDPDRFIRHHIRKLTGKLIGYCDQCPVLSFNDGRYD